MRIHAILYDIVIFHVLPLNIVKKDQALHILYLVQWQAGILIKWQVFCLSVKKVWKQSIQFYSIFETKTDGSRLRSLRSRNPSMSGFKNKGPAKNTYCEIMLALPPTTINTFSSSERRLYTWLSKFHHDSDWKKRNY